MSVTTMTSVRRCACGCGADLTGRDQRACYDTDACRARGWKRQRNYGPQTPRKVRSHGRSGLQVSFPKAVNLLTGLLLDIEHITEEEARHNAREILSGALSSRQRELLKARAP